MAIYVVDGKPRHGKTAWVMSHAREWLDEAQDSGFRLFSNVKINLAAKGLCKKYNNSNIGDILNPKDLADPNKLLFYWRNIDEWNYMTKGRIICDEATRYFNARQWARLSPDTEVKLQQHGKEELDIWAITQHYTRLDTTLRIMCEKFFRVERVWGWGNRTYLCRISEHQLEDLDRYEAYLAQVSKDEAKGIEKPEEYSYEHFWIVGRPIHWYDTKAMVLPSREMPLKHHKLYCEDPNCPAHGIKAGKPKIIHD